jgi:hypothetical protein
MVSTVIRGPPSLVLSVLLHGSSHTTILGPASHVEVVESLEPQGLEGAEVLRLVLEAPGWAGKLCAPREMIVQRLLKEESGMNVVLFSSIDHAKLQGMKPLAKSFRSLYHKPVLGNVRGNYIIAPLNGHSLETSPETMITCIVKVKLD